MLAGAKKKIIMIIIIIPELYFNWILSAMFDRNTHTLTRSQNYQRINVCPHTRQTVHPPSAFPTAHSPVRSPVLMFTSSADRSTDHQFARSPARLHVRMFACPPVCRCVRRPARLLVRLRASYTPRMPVSHYIPPTNVSTWFTHSPTLQTQLYKNFALSEISIHLVVTLDQTAETKLLQRSEHAGMNEPFFLNRYFTKQ